ncbi:hypothetical protein [Paenibacillus ginsengihumi]|uniref:hypothetical protein n=1 Tax=Paenibacillus ginsengihumi TaxID=431596 RepID=UPI0012EC5DB2|nr:hypothetical protein [Paenibacillus ginsengihumi]
MRRKKRISHRINGVGIKPAIQAKTNIGKKIIKTDRISWKRIGCPTNRPLFMLEKVELAANVVFCKAKTVGLTLFAAQCCKACNILGGVPRFEAHCIPIIGKKGGSASCPPTTTFGAAPFPHHHAGAGHREGKTARTYPQAVYRRRLARAENAAERISFEQKAIAIRRPGAQFFTLFKKDIYLSPDI